VRGVASLLGLGLDQMKPTLVPNVPKGNTTAAVIGAYLKIGVDPLAGISRWL
jgi:hypothetical protein